MTAATIRRVRVVGGERDPLLARLRLSRLLAGADVAPPSLAPSALLFVRALEDPLPRSLPLDGAAGRPPPAWEQAVSDSLAGALRCAGRPAREAVPAGAESVVFADRAELLACLARDACDGTLAHRWWWREFASAGPRSQAVVTERWLAAPEDVPAALELLTTQRLAARVLAWLPATGCEALTERIAARFGLPAPPAPPAGPPAPRRPPWAAVVPEAAPLDPSRARLFGVALTLRRAPALARSPAFAAAAWAVSEESATAAEPAPAAVGRRVADAAPAISTAPAPDPAHALASPHAPAPGLPPTGTLAPVAVPVTRALAGTPTPDGRAAPATPSAARVLEVAPVAADGVAPAPRRAPAVTWEDAAAVSDGDAGEPHGPGRPALEPARSAPRSAARDGPAAVTGSGAEAPVRTGSGQMPRGNSERDPFPAAPVRTAFGGAFYLLNLALFLGLYGDFTRPLEPGIALDPWDLVALLTELLAGPEVRSDPLWPLLARLAGRTARTPPGAGFRPPRAWRTPAPWLDPFERAGEWNWSAARETLRLRHPAGFVVAAVPRTASSAREQLERELRRIPAAHRPEARALRRTALRPERGAPLQRWAGRLGEYARARLRLALGLAAGEELADVLLRRSATVLASPSHLNIVLSLADLPLSVRFAGLDRTPGWLPAAGRHVALHFT